MDDAARLVRAATAIGRTQQVLDDLVLWLSELAPRARIFACLYRSHPALEMGVCSHARSTTLLELGGVPDAFADSPIAFDRWAVESNQRNRWRSVFPDRVASAGLIKAWGGSIGPQERIVLCQGPRALGYLSISLDYGDAWGTAELAAVRRRYRKMSSVLRLAALDWRSRHEPTDVSAATMKGNDGVFVLSRHRTVVAASPDARRALACADMTGFLDDVEARGWPGRRRLRVGTFEVESESLDSGSGRTFEIVRYTRRTCAPPIDLAEVPLADLTARERTLCEWVVTGQTNAQIARHMNVRPSTIKTMLERIYGKLSVGGRVALTQRLLRPDIVVR